MADAPSDSGFSLKKVFKSVAKFALMTVPFFLGLGMIDLAVWHYLPGGVELFSALKTTLLENPVAHGLSAVFSKVATALGGGPAVTAASMGATLDPTTQGLMLQY